LTFPVDTESRDAGASIVLLIVVVDVLQKRVMKAVIFVLVICLVTAAMVCADETARGTAAIESAAIPEGYEIGEKSLSPNGRFAILYPIRRDESAELPPNLLVCLKPYSVLTRIGTEGGRLQGERDQPVAKWNGNSIVAIWIAARWGMKDLAIYEIEADEIKRIQPIWRRVWLLFDEDFRKRFLSKYPDEKGSGVIFVSKGEGPDSKPELEFKGRKMLLNLFADNKPNLSITPHWTASLHAVWNLDTAELENVDFRPGPIEERLHY
jgi:hypothetical protein